MNPQKELPTITGKQYSSLLELLQKQCPKDTSDMHANIVLAISALKLSYHKYIKAYASDDK